MLRNKSRSKRYCEGQTNNLWELKMKGKGKSSDRTTDIEGGKVRLLGNQQII